MTDYYVPNTFVAGTTARASDLNTEFLAVDTAFADVATDVTSLNLAIVGLGGSIVVDVPSETATQAEMEAGTETDIKFMSPKLVLDSILSNTSLANAGVTASAAELNLLDGTVAGTAAASKALALGADKNVDTLVIADGGLYLGAGAGTAVTATAAELNTLDGVTATTSEINKLAGTPAGLTATELGYCNGVTSGIQGQLDAKQDQYTNLDRRINFACGYVNNLAGTPGAAGQNIDSITDNGVGDYTITYTTAHASGAGAVHPVFCIEDSGTDLILSMTTYSSSSVRVNIRDTGGTLTDPGGDLLFIVAQSLASY